MTAGGCTLFDSESPEDAATEFLDAFARGDIRRAAGLTDSPQAARAGLEQARKALEPKSMAVQVGKTSETGDSSSATATYRLTWKLAHDRTWSYESQAELLPGEEGWQIQWSPSVVHPELASQQVIALREQPPDLAPVLGRDGAKLLEPKSVVSILLYPQEAKAGSGLGQVAQALAESLSRFDSSITAKSIRAGAAKTKGADDAHLVAALRESDYLKVKSAIYDLPGVKFSKQERLLAPSRDFGAQVLPGIRSLVEKKVAGKAGWRVVALDSSGAETAQLHSEDSQPSKAVRTTLSRADQAAAEQALDGVGEPAMIVSMQASSGELLAVGQNEAANKQGAVALTGRYPPGSTFKIVTALATLSSGKATPKSTVNCPGTTVIGGRLIPNEDRFELGKVPLARAFARSCNTTFARLAAGLPAGALTTAARDLGIGADFEIPGITTITGSVPPTDSEVQRAENGFGQGKVLASPFGMALAAATVQAGKTPVPTLVDGEETKSKDLGEQPPADQLKALRTMMRKVVTEGTATRLAGLPAVYGKTGTAQFGDGTNSHGWFVGYQGDRAFAVLVVGGGSSKPAVEAAHRFLTALD